MDALTLAGVGVAVWLMLAVHMAAAWLIEQRTGNSGWVDVVWTSAMGLTGFAGAVAILSPGALSGRQILVAALIFIWALRLAGHIARRTTVVGEDPRYVKLRDQWGATASRNMFWLLQAQAALSLPMVFSVILAAWNPAPLFTIMDFIAVAVFTAGLAGSALADVQLNHFKQHPASHSRICNTGLWAWSRHPNYFFEWLIWVAFALLAINGLGDWGWGYLALAGPVCMYWLLRYVSGVPPLEDHMLAKYGADYASYQKSTSVFFPLPPPTPSR